MAHAGAVGFGALVERGLAVAETLPADLVYAGFSLGVMPAQRLAQTRPGVRGALLYSAAIPWTSSAVPGRTTSPSSSM